jgi:hypothetical protein
VGSNRGWISLVTNSPTNGAFTFTGTGDRIAPENQACSTAHSANELARFCYFNNNFRQVHPVFKAFHFFVDKSFQVCKYLLL